MEKTSKLGEILYTQGLINREDLTEALDVQKSDKRKLGEVLISKGWIGEETLAKILATVFQVPFVNLADVPLDKKALGTLSHELIQTYKVFPIALSGNSLKIATNDPLNISSLQDIQYKSGYLVDPVMASVSDIEKHIQEYSDSLHTMNAVKGERSAQEEGANIIQLVESIIRQAIKENASDIHLEPMKEKMQVRFRIDGVLYEKPSIRQDLHRNVSSRIKIIAGMDVAENRRPQDGRISFSNAGREYDIRLSTLPNVYGEVLVLRILSKNFENQSFDALGMDAGAITIMNRLTKRPHGLVLVTGPTGAGKTTTLYTMLKSLNDKSKNIISVEDPVEYEIEGINQTTTNKFVGYTFATSMRNILRQDPDIIMLGEIRDMETAEAAIRAALTGHLVVSTMHTNTAVGAITRLLEMDIEPFLISSAVNGVIAQRLVRRLCLKCKEESLAPEEILQEGKNSIPPIPIKKMSTPRGCSQCLHTGFWGRVGLFEILEINEDIREMILYRKSEREITQKAIGDGMKLLRTDGLSKVAGGLTSLEEVLHITSIV